jgi:hypothetical protein
MGCTKHIARQEAENPWLTTILLTVYENKGFCYHSACFRMCVSSSEPIYDFIERYINIKPLAVLPSLYFLIYTSHMIFTE